MNNITTLLTTPIILFGIIVAIIETIWFVNILIALKDKKVIKFRKKYGFDK